MNFNHPDGGGPLFLTTPLFAKSGEYMQKLADGLITSDGSRLHEAAQDVAEDLSMEVYLRAPWEFGDLRASGHPTVTLDDAVIYDRPPLVARLSEVDLREKAHLRYLFDPHRYTKGR